MAERERKTPSLKDHIPLSMYEDKKIWLDCASGDGYVVADGFIKGKEKNKSVKPGNYICVDMDKKKLKRMWERGCKTICIDLETSDIKEYVPKADVILCLETLEHLEKTAANRLVNDFVTILEKNGLMIVTFPSNASFGPKEGKLPNKHQPDVEEIYKNKKYFSDTIKTMWHKTHLLVFRGKK